jgi:membrane-associated protease RseP (regulator of RpoE activity)
VQGVESLGIEPLPGGLLFERQPLGRGFLGVDVIDLTVELRRHYGAPADRGVMVSAVAEDSPAAAAGVLVGDILLRFDGEPVVGADSFRSAVRGQRAGQQVEVELYRAGDRQALVIEMAERERPLVRLAPTLVAPRQLELRVDRLDGSDELIEIRVEELVDQVQRVLGNEASLAAPLRARHGADRESIERRMREVEAELAELEARLRAARSRPE